MFFGDGHEEIRSGRKSDQENRSVQEGLGALPNTSRCLQVLEILWEFFLGPHLGSCIQPWGPQHRKELELLE